MLRPGSVAEALQPYWEEMERCRSVWAYWSLLHIVLCVPDICCALETPSGSSSGQNKKLYRKWCEANLNDSNLSSDDWYEIRCKILHQGRTTPKSGLQYTDYVFGQPVAGSPSLHGRRVSAVVYLDVEELWKSVKAGVMAWATRLEANPTDPVALNVNRNLQALVRIKKVAVEGAPGVSLSASTSVSVFTLKVP